MADYVIESRTKDNVYLAHLPHRDLQGEYMLSKSYGARFTLAYSDFRDLTTTELEAGRTEIQIYRNGTKFFCGPLWTIDISSDNNTMGLAAESLASYLDVRQLEVATTYTNTYGNIAWALISGTQGLTGGDLGITRGTQYPGDGTSGTVTFKNGDYIIDAHSAVADSDFGFDWILGSDRIYHQYYPRISSRANVTLDFPGNIRKYGMNIQGKYLRNKVRTVGANSTFSDFAVDSTSLTKFGLRHYSESQTNITSVALLNAYNNKILQQRKDVKFVPNITVNTELINPFEGDITLGQIARVNIQDGYVQYNQDMRFTGFQYTIGKHGTETFNLYFNDMREVS